jgi:RNA polymerase-binding transcription factor DksA
MERLAAGTYGSCERCGKPISKERVEARPTVRTCITCAR